jgi:hypothetical protein
MLWLQSALSPENFAAPRLENHANIRPPRSDRRANDLDPGEHRRRKLGSAPFKNSYVAIPHHADPSRIAFIAPYIRPVAACSNQDGNITFVIF